MTPLEIDEHALLTPSAVLPAQFDRTRSAMGGTPMGRLLVALLAQALDDARKPATSKVGREARSWIAAEDPRVPLGFMAVCHALGLDPDAVRQQVWSVDARAVSAKRAIARGPRLRMRRAA